MEGEKKTEVKMTQEPTSGSRASVVVCEDAQPTPTSPFKRFLYHLWDNDQHLKSPEERKLVRKLDFGILICATLGWVRIALSSHCKDIRTNSHTRSG